MALLLLQTSPHRVLRYIKYLNTLEHSLLLEDYNAHNTTWLTAQYTVTRGTLMPQQLDTTDILLNNLALLLQKDHMNPRIILPLSTCLCQLIHMASNT